MIINTLADVYNSLRKRGIIYDMIYYIALSFSLCLCLLIDKRYLMSTNKTVYISAKKLMIDKIGFKRSLLCFLSSLPLFLLSALRYGIGTDYFYGYVPIFQTINSGHIQNTRAEKGYVFLNYIVSRFTDDYQWIFVITSALFVFISFYVIGKYSKSTALSLIIWFLSYNYLSSYSMVRQSLSCAMAMLAIPFLYSGKKSDRLKFIIIILCAATIHTSIALFLVLALLEKFNPGPVFFAVSTGVVFAFRYGIFNVVRLALQKMNLYYFNYFSYATERSTSNYLMLINIIITIIIIYIDYTNRELSQNAEWRITKWLQFIYIILLPLDGVIILVGRVNLIFSFPQFITLTNAVFNHKRVNERKYFIVSLIALFTVEYLFYFIGGSYEVFPYVSIFSR